MEFRPYEYQRRAIGFMLENPRCALFLDMGLGKSVIALTAVSRLLDCGEAESALVVAPKKVAESTWSAEAAKWDHLRRLEVAKVMGTPAQRRAALASRADVYVIGRDSLVWLMKETGGVLPMDCVVLDELSSFKSPCSQRFKALRLMTAKTPRVYGLTGTPAPNGLIDLWGEMYAVDRGASLGKSFAAYKAEYFDEYRVRNIVVRRSIKAGAAERIRARLEGSCLSMRAQDYLQLPPMRAVDAIVELSPAARAKYDEFEREQLLAVVDEHGAAEIPAPSAAALMAKLGQMANGAVYDEDGVAREIHRDKIERLLEILEEARSPVLVFYQYRHDAARVMASLPLGTRGRVYRDARDLEDWNAGKIDALLAHPASTAYGLNMQAGGHYIAWLGTGWNLELYQQANARLHRQGQGMPVTVYRIIARGTVDELAAAALQGKERAQDALMRGLSALVRKHAKEKK